MKFWIKSCFLIGILLVLSGVAFASLYLYSGVQARASVPPSILEKGTSQFVDVGGFKLHLFCSGQEHLQGPTVVFDAGLNGTFLSWMWVQPEVARFARAVSFDRGGHGLSDRGPRPRTSKKNAQELHAALQGAGIVGPYVLVGHSLGGLNVRTFAALYPEAVAGVVLMDAMHEDQRTQISALAWPPASELTLKEHVFEFFKTYIPSLGYSSYRNQLRQEPKLEFFSEDEWSYFIELISGYNHYLSIEDEDEAIPLSCTEFKKLNNTLGNKPIVVITAGKDRRLLTEDPALAAIFRQCQEIRFSLQARTLKLSKHSKHLIAHESDHGIPCEQPAIIVEAIRSLVGAL